MQFFVTSTPFKVAEDNEEIAEATERLQELPSILVTFFGSSPIRSFAVLKILTGFSSTNLNGVLLISPI